VCKTFITVSYLNFRVSENYIKSILQFCTELLYTNNSTHVACITKTDLLKGCNFYDFNIQRKTWFSLFLQDNCRYDLVGTLLSEMNCFNQMVP